MPIRESALQAVNLPPRFFLYDLPQIAGMLGMSTEALRDGYIYFEGRDIGRAHPDLLKARDISPRDAKFNDWRVVDRELIRWMRRKGFRVIDSEKVMN